jgi:hypothetical protein
MTKSITRKAAPRKPIVRKPVLSKLNDAQRNVLSSAAQCGDGAAVRPASMTERAAQKLGAALIENRLAREIRAKGGMPVWRRADDGLGYSLIITKSGRAAVEGDDGRKPSEASDKASSRASASVIAKANADPRPSTASDAVTPFRSERVAPREGSKLANVIALLGRKQGVGINDLTSATGWLPHTTRAALTGLRKRGFVIERTRSEERGSLYRIVGQERASTAA